MYQHALTSISFLYKSKFYCSNLDLYRALGFGIEMMFSPFHMIKNDYNSLLIYAIDEHSFVCVCVCDFNFAFDFTQGHQL